MPDAFLVLTAGGFLLGASLPKAGTARRAWLAWLGVLGLLAGTLGAIFAATLPHGEPVPALYLRIQASLVVLTIASALAHLVTTWRGWGRAGRVIGAFGFILAVLAGSNLLHRAMLDIGNAVPFPPKALSVALQTVSCAGAAAVVGLAFAAALFPLFGVTTPEASARAFRRLYRALLCVVVVRAVVSVGGVMALATSGPPARPVEWGWAAVRWSLGLVAVAALAWVGYRQAVRGRVFAAAAALLVGALCAMNAEQLALRLVRDTGLPF